MAYPTTITCRRCAPTMAPRQTSYAASGITASAKVEVEAGSMYWLTSRTRRSTSRSTWAVSWARRCASSPGSASCSRAPLDTHLESIGRSLPPGSCRASSTTLPPTQTLRCSISGGRCFKTSSRMFSPAAPRVELPAITLSSRLRLERASSSIDWRATSAEPSRSTTDCVWASLSRISEACDSCVRPPVSSRRRISATATAWPSARRTRLQARTATAATPVSTHTRRSANNSSNTDMWGIVVRQVGIDKGVNLMKMAAENPHQQPQQVPDRIPLEEVYMRMAEELAKRSTCARLQVGSVITTGDLTQVLGIGYNGNAKGLPNRCDSDQPGNCGCFAAGSLVMTEHGQVRIERIKVGDRVLTHKNRYRPVTELFRHQHSGAMVHLFLETRSDSNLQRRKTATPEHPFLVRREGEVDWVKAGDVRPGDELAVVAKDCMVCGRPIPHFRRMCPQCFTESSKSVAMRERHSRRMTERNPMRGIHRYDPSRSALSQQLLQKDTTRKVYQELVGLKSRFETQGFRAIVIDHTVRPDLILIGDGKVIGVEYDTRLFPKNAAKYEDRPDVRNQYDDILWIKRDRMTWDLHEGAFVWAAVSATKAVDVDVPVYNFEVDEDHSYVCQSAVVHNCIHSEQNALIKAGAQLPGKVMFVSASPCVMCAKMIINANVARVYYREAYRDPAGLNVLRQAGVETIHYDRWRNQWR